MSWTLRRYSPEEKELWDHLVATSRQGTLLHCRGYMDYHAERFQDCSLIAFRNEKPIAILPANRVEDMLFSHQGLTYGGWLTPISHFDGSDMLSLFEAWLEWCADAGIREIFYKPVPHIYHRVPAEEDIYALFRYGASPWITNLASVVDMAHPVGFNTLQSRNLKKAVAMQPWVRETDEADGFMTLVEQCLLSRHNARPVHTAEEMQTLKNRFPDQIRMFYAGTSDFPEAAVCVYDSAEVAHCQYIATTEEGREDGILSYLFKYLIEEEFRQRRYFDFGTSNEAAGMVLNAGLIRQKYGLGGRGVAYPSFRLSLTIK